MQMLKTNLHPWSKSNFIYDAFSSLHQSPGRCRKACLEKKRTRALSDSGGIRALIKGNGEWSGKWGTQSSAEGAVLSADQSLAYMCLFWAGVERTKPRKQLRPLKWSAGLWGSKGQTCGGNGNTETLERSARQGSLNSLYLLPFMFFFFF